MKNVFKFFLVGFAAMAMFTSCQDDDDHGDEQELITTFVYTLTPVGGGTSVVFSFIDSDGDGGNAPVINSSGPLLSGKTYQGRIVLRDDSSMPPKDITTEVKEEAEDHQFFYFITTELANKLSFSYADIDNNGKPVGLETDVMVTGGPGNGKIKIVLRHNPNKNGTGVSNGDITNAGGETDIEVEFDVMIQ